MRQTLQWKNPKPSNSKMFSFNLKALKRAANHKWSKSFFDLVWPGFIPYYLVYVAVIVLYTYGLNPTWQSNFNAMASYFANNNFVLPVVGLIIGYFTSTALNQWTTTVKAIPGIGKPIVVFMASLKRGIPKGQQLVEKYGRYNLLMWILTLRQICPKLKQQFPDLASLESFNYLTAGERAVMETYLEKGNKQEYLHMVVSDWIKRLIMYTDEKGYFQSPSEYKCNIQDAHAFEESCAGILKIAASNTLIFVSKIVTFVHYSYGLITILSHKLKEESLLTSMLSGYFPISALVFFVYDAWLKIGKMVYKDPFSEVNINKLLEENIQYAFRQCQSYNAPLSMID